MQLLNCSLDKWIDKAEKKRETVDRKRKSKQGPLEWNQAHYNAGIYSIDLSLVIDVQELTAVLQQLANQEKQNPMEKRLAYELKWKQ